MSLETNLNTTPYWDDYNEAKDFYKILFKPGVSIQTRELNQLQTILQKQVERFGDHVFKSGTIVSGVNFSYNSLLPYAKIRDLQENGQPVNPAAYVGLYVKNSANLQARVVKYESGFESKNPDLNTIYLNYINSGDSFDKAAFSNNDLLDVFNNNNQLYGIDVVNGGTGFANSDSLHVVPAINVTVASGSFTNGEIITQATTGARVQIVGITAGIDANNKILSVKPLNSEQLANTSANSTSWTVEVGYNIQGNTSSAVANVSYLVGGSVYGSISTDSLGIVQQIYLTSGGSSFTTLPTAVIKPASASASVSTLELLPRKNIAQIRVANSAFTSPVGYGYSFSVSEGVIYQKGIFSKVIPQSVIVSKYSSTPSNVSVGFTSDESIVKYTTDSTLYDNAANTYNETAPGADRLRVRPILYVVDTDTGAANSEFLPLVEFVDGYPAKENRNTVYNEIAKESERRTFETSGDFVINSFRAISKEIAANTTHLNIVVDPGIAYIKGKRVQTTGNVIKSIQKANTYVTNQNQTITANYGNYVKVKELAGFFDFKSGATVTLYDTAQTRLTSVTVGSNANISPSGNAIGTAKMRSIVYQEGTIGTPDAVYRLYLFDVNMNAGKSFANVLSFYFNGAYDGVCDAIQELNGTNNANTTFLYDTENPDIIFKTGLTAVKSISDISYTYRTSTENLTLNANGTIEITAPTTYTFPYSGSITLSSSQKADFIVAPVSNTYGANTTGTVAGTTSSANLVGTSTTFATDYAAGDYISVYVNTTAYDVKRVENVVNNTLIIMNSGLSASNNSTAVAPFFPAYYPLNLNLSGRTITTSANAAVATVNLNKALSVSANVVAYYNIKVPSAVQINKDLNRDLYVKIYTGNNVTISASGNNTSGPWNLGIPDAFRLKTVYYGNTASDLDVTKYFYLNSYNDGDTVNNAELRLIPGANLAISNTQWLLAKFDAFDVNASEGFVTINSYNDLVNDTSGYSNNTFINRLEIPETLTAEGRYYDSIDSFDFRPFTTNTAVYATSVASATVNPDKTQSLNSDEKYFPVPDSQISFDVDYYIPRIDRVVIDKFGVISTIQGTPDLNGLKAPNTPTDALSISRTFVPPYPSLAYSSSNTTFLILDKKVGNDTSIIGRREGTYTVKNISQTQDSRAAAKPYSMAAIGKLEQRINSIENQILLNQLETSIVNKTIPSSTNPAKDRFKNGFLVDDFNDFSVVDLRSNENSCFIDTIASELQPLKYTFNLESIFDRSDNTTRFNITQDRQIMLPYEEVALIQQLSSSFYVAPVAESNPPRASSPAVDSGSTTITPVVIESTGSITIRTSCPAPEMRILLADGSLKPAGQLQVGDVVKTQHETTLIWGEYPVTHVSIVPNALRIKFNFDNVEFICSLDHKFFLAANEWVTAKDICLGDVISGKTVRGIEQTTTGDVVRITVDDAHTYVCEDLLSHNKSPIPANNAANTSANTFVDTTIANTFANVVVNIANTIYSESIQGPAVIITGDLFQATLVNAKPGGSGSWTGASSGSFTIGAGGTFNWSFPWIYGPGDFFYNFTFDTGNSLTYGLRVTQKNQGNTTTNTVVTDTTVVTTNTAYIDTTATVDTGVITLVSTGGISVLSALDLFVGSTTLVTVVDDDADHDTSYWTDPLGDLTVVTGTEAVVGEQDGVNSTDGITSGEIAILDASWSEVVTGEGYSEFRTSDVTYLEGGSKGNIEDYGYLAY